VRFRDGDAPLLDADGSALVVHAGADDYESQPSGASGDRIACAEIKAQ
jgi:Cu-Zn family superoxide dismutase